MWQTKYASAVPVKFWIGMGFSAVEWRRFPHQASVVRGLKHIFRYLWFMPSLGVLCPSVLLPTDQTIPSRNSAQLCWVDTNICERDIVVNVTSLVEFQKMSHYLRCLAHKCLCALNRAELSSWMIWSGRYYRLGRQERAEPSWFLDQILSRYQSIFLKTA